MHSHICMCMYAYPHHAHWNVSRMLIQTHHVHVMLLYVRQRERIRHGHQGNILFVNNTTTFFIRYLYIHSHMCMYAYPLAAHAQAPDTVVQTHYVHVLRCMCKQLERMHSAMATKADSDQLDGALKVTITTIYTSASILTQRGLRDSNTV
jgi:hypothetical protein